ncbi:YecA family protein [Rossellomorea vietnamensis]|uniref:YecA family protein n=1 Tax=Rossellomorea vietnamensis TaxID=218284 RepID=UPI003CF7DFFB
MADKQLQAAMKNILSGLNNMKEEHEKSRFIKFWSDITIPLKLKDALGNFKKYELDDIRKAHDIQGVSSLKKADLQKVLEERILSLGNLYLLWDEERFGWLIKAASNGGHVSAGSLGWEQVEYLRTTGLIYSGTYNGEKSLVVPQELITAILELNKDENATSVIRRNTEWIKLTKGLLYYYGTLSFTVLIEMLEKYTGKALPIREYLYVIHEANAYRRKDIRIDDNGYSDKRVMDPKKVKEEHKSRSNVAYYPFTKDQLLTAGEQNFTDRNRSYLQFVRFLTANFSVEKDIAEQIVEECTYAVRIDQGPNEVMQYLSRHLEMDSMETLQEVADHVVHLMNNTRQWILKGYTPAELGRLERNHLQPVPSKEINRVKEERKAGRNDRCPCGSGKKYKSVVVPESFADFSR